MGKALKTIVLAISEVTENKTSCILFHVHRNQARLPGYKPGLGNDPFMCFEEILESKNVGFQITRSSTVKRFSFVDKKASISAYLTEIKTQKTGAETGVIYTQGENIILVPKKELLDVIRQKGVDKTHIFKGKQISSFYLMAVKQHFNLN